MNVDLNNPQSIIDAATAYRQHQAQQGEQVPFTQAVQLVVEVAQMAYAEHRTPRQGPLPDIVEFCMDPRVEL